MVVMTETLGGWSISSKLGDLVNSSVFSVLTGQYWTILPLVAISLDCILLVLGGLPVLDAMLKVYYALFSWTCSLCDLVAAL